MQGHDQSLHYCLISETRKPMEFRSGSDTWLLQLFTFSAITGQEKHLLIPNFVHRKMKSSGIPPLKIVLQECSYEKGRVAGINIPLIGCLHYLNLIHKCQYISGMGNVRIKFAHHQVMICCNN